MYQVGQVVYVIFTKKQRVIPVKIVEQIVRRSVDGESIQYLVNVPGRDESIDLGRLGSEIYSTIDEVQAQLRQNADIAITEMTQQAVELAHTHFPTEHPIPTPEELTPLISGDDTAVKVVLDDGTVANVKIGDGVSVGENVFINKKKVTN
tara:strand:+ start:36861 stop:37310 length:450 start_codon:yes stop_codon:yes gene_type:complete